MKTKIINTYFDGAYYVVTYKYWVDGQCACTATKIKRTFTNEPNENDLINAI